MVEPVYRRMPRARRPVTPSSHGPRRASFPPDPGDRRRPARDGFRSARVDTASHEARSTRAIRTCSPAGAHGRARPDQADASEAPPAEACRDRESHDASFASIRRSAATPKRCTRAPRERGGSTSGARRSAVPYRWSQRRNSRSTSWSRRARNSGSIRYVRDRGSTGSTADETAPWSRSTRRWWATAVREMPCSVAMTSASVPAECSPTASISTIRRRTGSARTENGWVGCVMRRG